MRQRTLVLTCALGALLSSGRDANAFWKYIGELSGPGYFVGLDFVFPWTFLPPKLDGNDISNNRAALRRLGVDLPTMEHDLDGFLQNKKYCEFFADSLDFDEVRLCAVTPGEPSDQEQNFIDNTTLDATTRAILDDLDPSFALKNEDQDYDTLTAHERFARLWPAVLERANRVFRTHISRYGSGEAGLFGSQRPLPRLQRCDDGNGQPTNCRDLNKNLFFVVAPGIAFAVKNGLDFPEDHDGDTDVIWLSLYQAVEKRFGFGRDNFNLFVNGGVALHRFVGPGFEDFTRASLKTRGGVRLLNKFYVGGEIEYFTESIPHSKFESTTPGEPDRVGWGLFVSIELVRPLNN